MSGRPISSSINKKTTCHEGRTTNHKQSHSVSIGAKQTTTEKRAHTLSESRSKNHSITPPANLSMCTLRSRLQPIDYLSLNDGFEDDTVTNSRKRKRTTHRP